MTLKELGLDHVDGYHITDLYDDYDYGIVTPDRRFKVDVNPSGSEWKTPDLTARSFNIHSACFTSNDVFKASPAPTSDPEPDFMIYERGPYVALNDYFHRKETA